jgi:hypothetical protein
MKTRKYEPDDPSGRKRRVARASHEGKDGRSGRAIEMKMEKVGEVVEIRIVLGRRREVGKRV